MSIGLIRGLGTLVIFIAFIGMLLWVFASKRKKGFEDAAMLPLVDDDPQILANALDAEKQLDEKKTGDKPVGDNS